MTFDNIIEQLQVFDIPAVKLVKICKGDEGMTERREIGVQFFCPKERSVSALKFVRSQFRGFDINYLQEIEMIDIRISELPDVFAALKIFDPVNN